LFASTCATQIEYISLLLKQALFASMCATQSVYISHIQVHVYDLPAFVRRKAYMYHIFRYTDIVCQHVCDTKRICIIYSGTHILLASKHVRRKSSIYRYYLNRHCLPACVQHKAYMYHRVRQPRHTHILLYVYCYRLTHILLYVYCYRHTHILLYALYHRVRQPRLVYMIVI
jgi:hypothetical protein